MMKATMLVKNIEKIWNPEIGFVYSPYKDKGYDRKNRT
jgi:hypothetical protein